MMAAGFVLAKLKKINGSGIKQMTTVLLWIVTPCVIINAFIQYTYTAERLSSMLWIGAAALIMHFTGFFISLFLFKRQPQKTKSVLRFGITFSNCGFMGIPLAQAVFGETGVFYASFFVVVFNIITWTLGVAIYGQKLNFKNAVLNPGVIGFLIALPIFFFKIAVPGVIAKPIGYFADLNSPLAMLVTGAILASVSLKLTKSDFKIFAVCAVRLIAVPIISISIMMILNMPKELLCISALPISAPTASNTSLFAVMFDSDAVTASRLVALCNILCIFTMPLIFAAASVL